MIRIRDTTLYVDIVGDGYPLVLMHGGPGLDHWTLEPLRQLSNRNRLIFYDQSPGKLTAERRLPVAAGARDDRNLPHQSLVIVCEWMPRLGGSASAARFGRNVYGSSMT